MTEAQPPLDRAAWDALMASTKKRPETIPEQLEDIEQELRALRFRIDRPEWHEEQIARDQTRLDAILDKLESLRLALWVIALLLMVIAWRQ